MYDNKDFHIILELNSGWYDGIYPFYDETLELVKELSEQYPKAEFIVVVAKKFLIIDNDKIKDFSEIYNKKECFNG